MRIFTKTNDSAYKDLLINEVKGINLLSVHIQDNPYLKTPKIRSVNENEMQSEYIDSSFPSKELSEKLAMGLAILHKKSFENYGLEADNYIGLNPQKNILSKNWGEFFYEYRLMFQVSLIKDRAIKQRFETTLMAKKGIIIEFLNSTCEHPSLVHGDLWSGNILYGDSGVYLIDPAVYFADREVDIAMSEMFGGFDEEFYRTYHGIYPLSKEYKNKRVLFNLYHYLNHYNLFDDGYFYDCEEGFNFIESLNIKGK